MKDGIQIKSVGEEENGKGVCILKLLGLWESLLHIPFNFTEKKKRKEKE